MRHFDRSQRLIRYRRSDRSTWPGMAFILESLLLLLFVSASLAVLMSLFVQANLLGEENAQRSEAIIVATNVAEAFAQDPVSVESAFEQDGYQVTCQMEPRTSDAGTLTLAHIAVAFEDNVLYELTTAAYESKHEAKGTVELAASQVKGEGEEILDGPGGAQSAPNAATGSDSAAAQTPENTDDTIDDVAEDSKAGPVEEVIE